MKGSAVRRNLNKYCRYHQDYRHDIKECFKLKEEIETLISKG